jgi:hypothetical protein
VLPDPTRNDGATVQGQRFKSRLVHRHQEYRFAQVLVVLCGDDGPAFSARCRPIQVEVSDAVGIRSESLVGYEGLRVNDGFDY